MQKLQDWFLNKYWYWVIRPTLKRHSPASIMDVAMYHLQWEVARSTLIHQRRGCSLRVAIANALCDWDL